MRYKFIIIIASLFFASCDGDPYHGFGCIAPESHPAVAHARSISPEQLKMAYLEISELSKKYAQDNYETQIFNKEISSSLSFLEAELIHLYRSGGPYVILANCFDERIELRLSSSEQPEATITLYWAEPTNENPYATGKQLLWQGANE